MTDKDKTFSIIYIITGVLLIIFRFFGNDETWSVIDTIKLIVGILILGYGIYMRLKKK